MFKYSICLIFFIFYSSSSIAQNKSKAETDELIWLSTIDSTSNQNERLDDLKNIKFYSRKIGYEQGLAFAHIGLANLNRESSVEISLGHIAVVDSLIQFGTSNFTDTLFIQYAMIKGYMLGASGDYPGQLSYYFEADSVCKLTNNTYLQSFVNQNIAFSYYNREDYSNALIYTKALLQYYGDNKAEHKFSYLNTLVNTGSIYNKLTVSDSTIKFVKLAIEQDLASFQDLSFPYLLLGNAYLNKGDFIEAKKYESLVYAEQDTLYDYSIDGILAHQLSGKLAMALNELPEALFHYKLALKYSDSIKYDYGKIDGNYNVLTTLLKQQNNQELSSYFEGYILNKDSLYSRKSLELENQLLVQYETNKKEHKIEQLKFDNERLNYKNQKQRNRIIAIVFSLIIIVLIATVLINKYRHKQKLISKKLENQQLLKTILSKDLELSKKDLQQAIGKLEDKSHLISKLKSDLQEKTDTTQNIDSIINLLDQSYIDENNWAKIVLNFDALNDDFSKKITLRFPAVNNNDIRLLILIKLGYSIKGIAEVNNITEDSVKKRKNRLLKKMEISSFKLLAELHVPLQNMN